MTIYTAPNNKRVDLDDDTIADLEALATITRETTAVLAARAVEALRRELVPTALKRPPAPAATGGRGRGRRSAETNEAAETGEEAQA